MEELRDKNNIYINMLNEFYSTVDFKPISSNAISIYLFVLHTAFKNDFTKEISVANTTLINKLRLTIKELQTARNELITKGYITYKKGCNQNNAPKYSIIRKKQPQNEEMGQAEGQAKGNAEEQSKGQPEGYIITILDLYFNYIINNQSENFLNLNAEDKKAIITILKKLDLYIQNIQILEYMQNEQILELKIQYWVIKELYLSPYKIYLKDLTRERFLFRFLKSKKYVPVSDIYRFLNYFIKSMQEDLKRKEGGENGNN